MTKIINLCTVKTSERPSEEYKVSPDALLTVLKRIKLLNHTDTRTSLRRFVSMETFLYNIL